MLDRLAPLFAVAALSGCSLILDTGDLPHAPFDADPPDAIPIDANRMGFSIMGLMDGDALEGVGAKGIPTVLRFSAINAIDPVVTAVWSDGGGGADPIEVVDYRSANDFNEVAVAIRIPVRPTPDQSEASCSAMIHFDFVQTGSDPAAADVALHCLDELTLNSVDDLVNGKQYSQVDITGPLHFPSGTDVIQIVATGDITIAGVVDVDAAGTTGGRAGSNGAPAGGVGGGLGGGSAGADSGLTDDGGGGGGGGYLTAGANGVGGATGGALQGHRMVVPLGTNGTIDNRGAGGGGGGAAAVLGTPGAGGGGGGVIALIAGGEVRVAPTAVVAAAGADGGAGTMGVTGAAGGGGGGSGGAILIRSGAGVVFTGSPFGWLNAPGGAAGASPANDGGAGAPGRVRIDQPLASPGTGPMVLPNGGAGTTGPTWDPATIPFSTDGSVSLQLRATGGDYGILLNGTASTGGNATVLVDTKTVTVTGLARGKNEICALYDALPAAASQASLDEAKTCVDVVYIPH